MKETICLEYQKVYIPDEKVKTIRDIGFTNFSKFVRDCVDEHIRKAQSTAKLCDVNGTPGANEPHISEVTVR